MAAAVPNLSSINGMVDCWQSRAPIRQNFSSEHIYEFIILAAGRLPAQGGALERFGTHIARKSPLSPSSVLELRTEITFRSGTQVARWLEISPFYWNSRLTVSKGCSKCR